MAYKIWVVVAEAYGYVIRCIPYQGAKLGKQVASSTKWGLGDNVVLCLIEYLTPTVSLIFLWVTISSLFVCLPTLELPTFFFFSTKMSYMKTKIGHNTT